MFTKHRNHLHHVVYVMGFVSFAFLTVIASLIFLSKSIYEQRVQHFLDNHSQLIKTLTFDPQVKDLLKVTNTLNENLSIPQIHNIDQLWIQSDENNEYFVAFISNDVSQLLLKFQQHHLEFTEIFITDQRGLIAALTNKTSDYNQADEQWWQKAVEQGVFIGDVEYDQSIDFWSYFICRRIDDDSGQMIGVIKAVLDIREVR